MSDQTPPRASRNSPEKENERDSDNDRPVAVGALRRVYNSRRRARERGLLRLTSRKGNGADDDSDEDSSDDDGALAPVTQNTSHHYTLNMPGSAAAQSDLPYVLLGCVNCDKLIRCDLTVTHIDIFNSSSICHSFCYSCICSFNSS